MVNLVKPGLKDTARLQRKPMKKKKFEFLQVNYLKGPGLWTYVPIIEAWVDLGELEQCPSNTIPGFYERLTQLLPSLVEHHCGVGEYGGFLKRLREGTWAGHILEHVVIELHNLSGLPVTFGQARETDDSGIYKVVFESPQEQVGREALVLGRELVMAAINDEPFNLKGAINTLKELIDDHYLGPSTAHIVQAATERKIPHIRLNEVNLVQLGYGCRQRRIWTAETDGTSAIAESIASDKHLTKSLLKSCGIPVPEGEEVNSAQEAWVVAQELGLPVVIKPSDGNHGRGVFLNLRNEHEVLIAYAEAKKEGSSVLVERHIQGESFRLLVVGRHMVAASKGKSISIRGNGQHTVQELIDAQINSDPRCGYEAEYPLSPIVIRREPTVQLELQKQGLAQDSVPEASRVIVLKPHGGNLECDCTDDVHPEVARVAALAARVVGLDIAGIDIVTPDITQPLSSVGGAINEVNAGPGLLMHIKPLEGQSRPVGRSIVDHLFPTQTEFRIPVVGITGSQHTTCISRLVSWLLHISGCQVGLACQDGVFLDNRCIDSTPSAHWAAGQRILINRSVEAAVFEHHQENILREGLPYDRCLVGVVTDMHSLQDLSDQYIRTPKQHFRVVRTQVDVVLPEGTAVLNASDPQLVEMADLCDGKVIFYAPDAQLPALLEHRQKGERTVYLSQHDIVMASGSAEISRISLQSLNKNKASKPEMVMSAVAAAWALDIKPELISAGLRTFKADTGTSY
jgi:cyanophycin synthetase